MLDGYIGMDDFSVSSEINSWRCGLLSIEFDFERDHTYAM